VRLPTRGRDAELGARLAERLHCRVLQRDFVAAKVAPFKKIRRVESLEAVPKSSSGKILHRRPKTAYSSMSVLAM
jgi:acyl-coenzyme A synthetase/AMP-(fatty) acid ligase